jgi:hypothetical protein
MELKEYQSCVIKDLASFLGYPAGKIIIMETKGDDLDNPVFWKKVIFT